MKPTGHKQFIQREIGSGWDMEPNIKRKHDKKNLPKWKTEFCMTTMYGS